MTTCRYLIKNTNNPRICNKNAPENNTFCEQGVCGLHMCNHHFNIIQKQIINMIGIGDARCPSGPNGGSINFEHYVTGLDEDQRVQMYSLLQCRKEEFFRESEREQEFFASIEDSTDELPENEWQNILTAFQILEDDAKQLTQAVENDPEPLPDPIVSEQQNEESKSVVPEQKQDCPICMEQIPSKNFVFLECAHGLCADCLRGIERRNMKQQCPVCRHEF